MVKNKRVMRLKIAEFDLSLLPAEARTPGRAAFREAVSQFLRKQFRQLGGVIETLVFGPDTIEVTWTPERGSSNGEAPDPMAPIAAMLTRGELREGVTLLRFLLSDDPDNPDVLYNLGMVLSDRGQMDEAVVRLRRLVVVAPDHVNGLVALGVALTRQNANEQALPILQRAAALNPDNVWAQRNLGGCLLKLRRPAEAVEPLRKATALDPQDARAWYGLGQVLELTGDDIGADAAYKRMLAIDEFGETAKLAEEALSQLAARTFRKNAVGLPRMDAVMYCLGALKTFEKLTPAEVRNVEFEIAMLGTRGLDVNDPAPKYTLRSLPGQFSGLNLVALMYVAAQQRAPGLDVGFDLAQEYAMALGLHRGEAAQQRN